MLRAWGEEVQLAGRALPLQAAATQDHCSGLSHPLVGTEQQCHELHSLIRVQLLSPISMSEFRIYAVTNAVRLAPSIAIHALAT